MYTLYRPVYQNQCQMLSSKLLSFHFHFPCIQGIERLFFCFRIQRRPLTIQACLNHAKHYEAGSASNGRAVVSLVTPSLLTCVLFGNRKGMVQYRQISQDGPKFQEFGCKWNMINLSLSYSAFFSQKDCNVTSEQLPLSLVTYLALSSTVLKFFLAGPWFNSW